MPYPDAYIEYLVHFHADRDWFECHEILEQYWKEHPDDPKSRTWVGLIQVAVSLYHHRRGNREGAVKMMAAALRNLDERHLAELGIDAGAFVRLLEQRYAELRKEPDRPFADLDIPIADRALTDLCLERCREKGVVWSTPSDLGDEYLLHKHTLRDRSGIVEARERERERRRQRR